MNLGSPARFVRSSIRKMLTELQAASLSRLSAQPVDPSGGFARGTPIDRYYIERFLQIHADDIKGHVLEVAEDRYSSRFGGSKITALDLLNIAPSPGITIVGDLAQRSTLPEATFDCVILTQVLQYIEDLNSAIDTIHQGLRPGGLALVTVPAISRIFDDHWLWTFTDDSMRALFEGPFGAENVAVASHGNCFAATAFLHGLAVEDVSARKLDRKDGHYPICVTVAARKRTGHA